LFNFLDIAASALGRDFLVSNQYGRQLMDTYLKVLSDAPNGKAAKLKKYNVLQYINYYYQIYLYIHTISVHCQKIYNLFARALETGRKVMLTFLACFAASAN
jgi:hypothetical protein